MSWIWWFLENTNKFFFWNFNPFSLIFSIKNKLVRRRIRKMLWDKMSHLHHQGLKYYLVLDVGRAVFSAGVSVWSWTAGHLATHLSTPSATTRSTGREPCQHLTCSAHIHPCCFEAILCKQLNRVFVSNCRRSTVYWRLFTVTSN